MWFSDCLLVLFFSDKGGFHCELDSEPLSGRLKGYIRSLKISVLGKKVIRKEKNKREYSTGKDLLGCRVCLLPTVCKHSV